MISPARILLLLTLSTLTLFGEEPWPGVKFSEVRAYVWHKAVWDDHLVLKDMKLRPGVMNKGGTLLSAKQANRLVSAFSGELKPYAKDMCYFPRNAFVFYDADKKPVAFIEVCFSCVQFSAAPKTPHTWPDFRIFAAIFEELNLPVGGYKSLKSFNQKFAKLRKQFEDSKKRSIEKNGKP